MSQVIERFPGYVSITCGSELKPGISHTCKLAVAGERKFTAQGETRCVLLTNPEHFMNSFGSRYVDLVCLRTRRCVGALLWEDHRIRTIA